MTAAEQQPERSAGGEREAAALLREAWTARALAEAAEARAELARTEAEAALQAAQDGHRVAEAARRRHEFLSSAGRLMAESMDYPTTLQQVVRAAVPVLADWCAITMIREDGSPETLAAAHRDPACEPATRALLRRFPPTPDGRHGMARTLRTGEVELLREVTDEHLAAATPGDAGRLDALRSLAPRSVLTVPLRTPTQTVGAISFVLTDPARAFAEEDVEVAVSLGARAALHVQNARMYTERSRIAQTLQRSLLPAELPAVPGLDVAARYRAAGAQHQVGGDFYDLFPAGAGTWIAFVGDVSGKGSEAAAMTALTRHTLFAASLRGGDPADHLQLANDAMRGRGDPTRFATLVHVRVRPQAAGALLTVTNAGHLPPLVVHGDGNVEELRVHGTLLGVVERPPLERVNLALAPGDALVLYTDGVTELRGRRLGFGQRQLEATLRSRAGCPAAVMAEAVERHSVELAHGRPADDMAILVLRVPPA